MNKESALYRLGAMVCRVYLSIAVLSGCHAETGVGRFPADCAGVQLFYVVLRPIAEREFKPLYRIA